MSNAKTKSTIDSKRLRAFGQNIELCAHIKGLTLEAVAKEAQIKLSLITSFLDGRGSLTPDVLERLALGFGLSSLELIGTNGPLERRTQIFKELLDADRPIEVPLEDFDHALMRGSQKLSPQVGVAKDDPDGGAEQASEQESVDGSAPQAGASVEPSSAGVIEDIEQLTQQNPIDAAITWDRSGYRANYQGRTYNLKDYRVRKSVSQRLKEVKGRLTSTQLAAKIKKHPSWLSNLTQGAGDLDRDHLERLAWHCRTSVVFLLTGKSLAE